MASNIKQRLWKLSMLVDDVLEVIGTIVFGLVILALLLLILIGPIISTFYFIYRSFGIIPAMIGSLLLGSLVYVIVREHFF